MCTPIIDRCMAPTTCSRLTGSRYSLCARSVYLIGIDFSLCFLSIKQVISLLTELLISVKDNLSLLRPCAFIYIHLNHLYIFEDLIPKLVVGPKVSHYNFIFVFFCSLRIFILAACIFFLNVWDRFQFVLC